MKYVVTLIMAATAAGAALADSGLKPGLWEMRVVRNVVDGHDQSAQMAGASAKMQEAMSRLTPEQREQMGAMMQQHGGMALGDGGAIRMCISPEMARRDVPVVDKDGSCQPTNVRREGNHLSYELNCTTNGVRMSGTGDSTFSGDAVTTRSDMTMVERGQTHHMQNEMEMKFVKSDCGNVKPVGADRHN